MKSITVDNTKKVNKLIKMLQNCDGETINYILKESGKIDYVFSSHIATSELLRNHVNDVEDVEELVKRLNYVKVEALGIHQWAVRHGINIELGMNSSEGMGLCTFLGNLDEIADLDNELGWMGGSFEGKGIHFQNRYMNFIDAKEIEAVSRIEYVVDGNNYNYIDEAIEQYKKGEENLEFFFRYWVKVKGIDKPIEANITSMTNNPIVRPLEVKDLTLDSTLEQYSIKYEGVYYEVHVLNDSNGRTLTDVFSEGGKPIGGELYTKIKELVAKIDN